ncbi:hypothetical protein [Aquibacillus koreensis]|nr:hypothetical protein [Aquibacillus koreensis]
MSNSNGIDMPSYLRKTLISVPILFIIVGKIISITEKRKNQKRYVTDIGIVLGLTFASTFYLLDFS